MKVSFRLSNADRERYGGDEWVTIDTDRFADLDYDRLEELERDIKLYDRSSINKILGWEWPIASNFGFRGMVWLARQLAGVTKPDWQDFKPNPHGLGADFKVIKPDDESTDTDPPAHGSSEPPSESAHQVKPTRSKKD